MLVTLQVAVRRIGNPSSVNGLSADENIRLSVRIAYFENLRELAADCGPRRALRTAAIRPSASCRFSSLKENIFTEGEDGANRGTQQSLAKALAKTKRKAGRCRSMLQPAERTHSRLRQVPWEELWTGNERNRRGARWISRAVVPTQAVAVRQWAAEATLRSGGFGGTGLTRPIAIAPRPGRLLGICDRTLHPKRPSSEDQSRQRKQIPTTPKTKHSRSNFETNHGNIGFLTLSEAVGWSEGSSGRAEFTIGNEIKGLGRIS